MLLVIHNLPSHFRYLDIKAMIQAKCGLTEVILDNLMNEGTNKKVTVGLAEEGDAAILVRKINGLFVGGQQLYVEDVRQKKASEQPYRAKNVQETPSEDYNKYATGYQETQPVYSATAPMGQEAMPVMLNYNMAMGGMYYVPAVPAQTSLMGYGAGAQAAPLASMMHQFPNATVKQDSFDFKYEVGGPSFQSSNAPVWESNEDVAHNSSGNRNRQAPPKRGQRADDKFVPTWNDQDPHNSSGNRNRQAPPKRGQRADHKFVPTWNDQDPHNSCGNRNRQAPPKRGQRADDKFVPTWNDQDPHNSSGNRNRQAPPKRGQRTDDKFVPTWNDQDPHNSSGNRNRQAPPKRGQRTDDKFVPTWNDQDQDSVQLLKNRNWNSQNQYQTNVMKYEDDSKPPYEDYEGDFQQRPHQSRQSEYNPRQPAARSETYNSNTFRNPIGPETSDRMVSFKGSNATESHRGPATRWDQPKTDSWGPAPTQSRYDPNQNHPEDNPYKYVRQNTTKQEPQKIEYKDRNQGQGDPSYQPHNDKYQRQELAGRPSSSQVRYQNRPQYEEPKPFQGETRPQRPLRPSRPVQNWPNNTKSVPTKRVRKDNYDQPPKKRFAGESASHSRDNSNLQTADSESPSWQNTNLWKNDKSETWRNQVAAQIARQMYATLKITGIGVKDDITKYLRRNIKARIDAMLGKKLFLAKEEIYKRYRSNFAYKDDQAFFLQVLDKYKIEMENGGTETNIEQPAKEKVGKQQQKEKPATSTKELQKPKIEVKSEAAPTPAKLPKYPDGDKKLHSQLKQIKKQEFQDESLYTLEPALQKALDEQCDILCDLFMGECETPDNEEEKPICERIMDVAADEFRKVLRVNMTKRLLNVSTGLQVRVFSSKGTPTRASLDSFLKEYGVICLKKSDKQKMYIATCDSYEHYDGLCGLGVAQIDGVTVSFKPLHVCGPPPKITKAEIAERRRKFIESQIDDSGEDTLELEEDDLKDAWPEEDYLENARLDEEVDFSQDVSLKKEVDFSKDVGEESKDLDCGDHIPQQKLKEDVKFDDGNNDDVPDVDSVDDDDLEDY